MGFYTQSRLKMPEITTDYMIFSDTMPIQCDLESGLRWNLQTKKSKYFLQILKFPKKKKKKRLHRHCRLYNLKSIYPLLGNLFLRPIDYYSHLSISNNTGSSQSQFCSKKISIFLIHLLNLVLYRNNQHDNILTDRKFTDLIISSSFDHFFCTIILYTPALTNRTLIQNKSPIFFFANQNTHTYFKNNPSSHFHI